MRALSLLLICVWVLRGSTSMSISSVGCGIEKVCFSQPTDCNPAADMSCYFMSVMSSPNTSAITIELQGQANGYISFGFSDDTMMGNVSDITASMMDGVISCSFISRNPISTMRTTGQDSTYFLMFAYGSSIDGGSESLEISREGDVKPIALKP
ncbi:hypothetical protein SRHO_G00058030 [Serrasalmus rhombeus]